MLLAGFLVFQLLGSFLAIEGRPDVRKLGCTSPAHTARCCHPSLCEKTSTALKRLGNGLGHSPGPAPDPLPRAHLPRVAIISRSWPCTDNAPPNDPKLF